MHTFHFDDQYHTHQSYGYSIVPGGQEIVGDQEAFLSKKGELLLYYNACILHNSVVHPSWGFAAFNLFLAKLGKAVKENNEHPT